MNIKMNFKELIDLTIGSPDPGHVNFYALHCLLYAFAEKLSVLNETVDCSKYGNVSMLDTSGKCRSDIVITKKFEDTKRTNTNIHRKSALKNFDILRPNSDRNRVSSSSDSSRSNYSQKKIIVVKPNSNAKNRASAGATSQQSIHKKSEQDLYENSGCPLINDAYIGKFIRGVLDGETKDKIIKHMSGGTKNWKCKVLHRKFDEMTRETAQRRMSGGAEPIEEEEAANETQPPAETPTEAAAEPPPAEETEMTAPPEEPQPTEETNANAEQETLQETAEEPAAELAENADQEAPPEAAQEAPTAEPVPQEEPQAPETAAEVVAEESEAVEPLVESASKLSKDAVEIKPSAQTVTPAQLSEDINKGVAIMKDQLDLAMEQLNMLTNVTLNGRPEPFRLAQLRALSDHLRAIQRENVYIEGMHHYPADDDLGWLGVEEEMVPDLDEKDLLETRSDLSYKTPPAEKPVDNMYDIDLHLCYAPEKILDQVLDLKSEFCMLSNKVNDMAAAMIEQDCQRTMMILQTLQDQMRDVKYATLSLKEAQERVESREHHQMETIDNLSQAIKEVRATKVEREEMEVELAGKVNFEDLNRKVSHEYVLEMQCRLEKQFCELQKLVESNEKTAMLAIEDMQVAMGFNNVDDVLKKFKEKIDSEISALQDRLTRYLESTNDDCAAAGARIKVLRDLACVSCDATCVMRTQERAKVSKLPSAHASSMIAPLVTYELGTIRKSGIMGYYRKDEFPHAPNAWLNKPQEAGMSNCVPRHAGGPHTTHTAKDHVQKVLLSKK